MSNRRLVPLLLGAFIILAIVVVLQNPRGNPEEVMPTAEVTESPLLSGTLLRVFPELTVLDIQAVRIESPAEDRSFTIARGADGEWISPDTETTLEEGSASDIARTIVLLPYGRSINIVPDTNLELYGIAPIPQYLISIVLSNGEGHIIAVGKLSEDDPIYYSLVDERDEIFEVERGAIEFLTNFLN